MLELQERSLTWSPSRELGLTRNRQAQGGLAVFPGATVVSADSHLTLTEDLFLPRFPARLKDKAPRIHFDEQLQLFQMTLDGKPLIAEEFCYVIRSVEDVPGCASMPARMRDLDAERIDKEIVFPQIMALFNSHPDLEFRRCAFRTYNDYIASLQADYPTRFFPVAMPNYWDMHDGPKSVEEIARLGLKTFMLPLRPAKRADGSAVHYQDETFDPMWAAAQAANLPVCFHIGERLNSEGTNGYASSVLESLGPSLLRLVFGQLVFGGVSIVFRP